MMNQNIRSSDQMQPSPFSNTLRSKIVQLGLILYGFSLLLLSALLVNNGIKFIYQSLELIAYPYGFNLTEGAVLNQVITLMGGKSLYSSIAVPPYIINSYTPIYHVVTAAVATVVNDPLSSGRIVSTASTLLTALLIGMLVWRALGPGFNPVVRFISASIGGLAFLTTDYTYRNGPLMRVDMLALLLSISGVFAFTAGFGTVNKMWPSVALFLLAFYTKQSSLAGAASCFTVALLANRLLALRLIGIFAGALVAIFIILNSLTHGEFFFHTVKANLLPYSWDRTFKYLSDLLFSHPFYFLIACASVAYLLKCSPPAVRSPSVKNDGDGARLPHDLSGLKATHLTLLIYLPVAFISSLSIGRAGASLHYWVELMAITSVFVGIGMAFPFVILQQLKDKNIKGGLLIAALAIMLPGFLTYQVSGLYPGLAKREVWNLHFRPRLELMSAIVRRIAEAKGPVLSDEHVLVIRAGKSVEIDPFPMTQLSRQGIWDQRNFVDTIRNKKFDLIVLKFDVEKGPDKFSRFSREMVAAMRQNYVQEDDIGGLKFYRPRRFAE